MSQQQHTGSDPGLASAITGQPASAPAQKYSSCSYEELIALEMEAWALGSACAIADGARALRDLAAIEQAAEVACDEALRIYVPLDLARFHDVFTLAWIGGYCAARGSDAAYGAR
jgi:hypothetical protein